MHVSQRRLLVSVVFILAVGLVPGAEAQDAPSPSGAGSSDPGGETGVRDEETATPTGEAGEASADGTDAASPQRVRIGVLDNFPPFAFEVRGKLMGFTVDYLRLLSDKSGIEFELVSGTWEDILARFKAGTIDAITAISYTRDRTAFTRFTEPYYRIPTVVYTREGSFEYNGVADLAGKVVGIEADVYYKKYLSDYPDIEIEEIEDTNQLLRELSFGDLDAVVTNINIGDYMIKQHMLENVGVAGGIDIPEIEDEDLRIGVRRELEELHDALESGMDRISPQEYNRIQDRWVGFAPQQIEDTLLPSERQLVAEYANRHGGVRVTGHPGWFPIDFVDQNGEHAGISADLISRVSRQYDIPFVFERSDSFEQAIQRLAEGEVDVIPAVLPTPRLRETLAVSKPYLSLPLVIATRKKEFFVGELGNLAGSRVGILARGPMPDVLSQKYPGIEFTDVDSTREGLERVVEEEDFAFIGTVPAIAYAIQEYGFYNIKISGRLEEKRAIAVAVAEEDRRLLGVIEKTLRSISVEERESVVDEWISVSVERRVDRTVLWRVLIGAAVVAVAAIAWIRKVHSYNVQLSRAYRMLEEKNAELETLSVTNQLTGLYNRNKLDTELAREVARSNRYESPLSVIMLDLDGFKAINDRFGHQSGDSVLKAVAERIRYIVRSADIPGRWGGEEFLIICPETHLGGAEELAERLRQEIAATPSRADTPVTASFGVSRHTSGETAEQLVQRVDRNLYEAKRAGKDRVIAD